MNIWLVSPAWGRYAVTQLALEQRRWLCDTLAARGWPANSVIVSDDDNLDIAASYGFETVECDNSDLGARFNAGYRYAAEQGADIFVHVGSDDWVHPDAFDILDGRDLDRPPSYEEMVDTDGAAVWSDAPQIVAQRNLTLIDLERGNARRCHVTGHQGCIPWIMPRSLLEPSGFAPIEPGLVRGIDGALARGLPDPNWVFQQNDDPLWLVDFKTRTNITSYGSIADAIGVGEELSDPWAALADFYPAELVALARETASLCC